MEKKKRDKRLERERKRKEKIQKKIAEHNEHLIHTQVKNSPPAFDF